MRGQYRGDPLIPSFRVQKDNHGQRRHEALGGLERPRKTNTTSGPHFAHPGASPDQGSMPNQVLPCPTKAPRPTKSLNHVSYIVDREEAHRAPLGRNLGVQEVLEGDIGRGTQCLSEGMRRPIPSS